MGIHYDYKSTRNEKAMKKEAKRKARIEERRAKKGLESEGEEKKKNARYRQANYSWRSNQPQ